MRRPIADLIGRCRNRVALAGIELEGGWTKLPPGGTVIRDGSVRIEPPQMPAAVRRAYAAYNDGVHTSKELELYKSWMAENNLRAAGELPSPPMQWAHVAKWVRDNYPQLTNATCGLHMHMSFRDLLHYQMLLEPGYPEAVVTEVTRWAQARLPGKHAIWSRLNGGSEYCQLKYFGAAQAALKEKRYERHAPVHRYTAINYAQGTHSTIECRLLPMFDTADEAIEALTLVRDITNAYLVSRATPEPVLRIEAPLPEIAGGKTEIIGLEV
jgi:hypothetical protein